MKGTEAIVEILAYEDIPFAVVYPGSGIENVIVALARDEKKRIRCILPRHERVGMDILDGYARVSGKAGVGLVCGGPGGAHALTGISQSFCDSIPALLLKGQQSLQSVGTRSIQSIPTAESFKEVTKWAFTVYRTERLPEVFRRAFTALRSGRLGPVVLELPVDVTSGEIPDDQFSYRPVNNGFRYTADPADVEEAADLLAQARNPYMVAGMGVLQSEASDELRQLSELLSAPVGTTLNGKSAFSEDHPLSVGMGGYPRSAMSTPQARYWATRADVVLGVGNSFLTPLSSQGAVPEGVKLIHVNIDPLESNRTRQPEVVRVGDARLVLKDLLAALRERLGEDKVINEDKAAKIKEMKEAWQTAWTNKANSTDNPIHPYAVTWEIMQNVDRANTIILHDSGLVRWHLSYIYEAIAPRTYLGMGGQSLMGWTIGASMGAKLARPDALVIGVMGDGAFGMTGMDIETAVRMNLPFLCLIQNNTSLGICKPGYGDNTDPVDLGGDYTKVAQGLDAHAQRVEDRRELASALKNAIAAIKDGRPSVLEVMVALEGPMPAL